MKKKKVKFNESFAGLGDPDVKKLDEKYLKQSKSMEARKIPQRAIAQQIANQKILDRYEEKPIGMPKDFAFKSGEEAMIPEELAEKWIAAGICNAVLDEKVKAA
jgi:hypothetical protein